MWRCSGLKNSMVCFAHQKHTACICKDVLYQVCRHLWQNYGTSWRLHVSLSLQFSVKYYLFYVNLDSVQWIITLQSASKSNLQYPSVHTSIYFYSEQVFFMHSPPELSSALKASTHKAEIPHVIKGYPVCPVW